MHQIGEVAERVGLSLRTVRHYDEAGLVVPSGRTPGGFRLYTDDDIERLALIKRMKPLGFTLDEMRELLALRDRLVGTAPTRRTRSWSTACEATPRRPQNGARASGRSSCTRTLSPTL